MRLCFIGTLALLALQSSFVAVVRGNACLSKNPALPLMQSKGLKVFDKVTSIKEIHNNCKNEWTKFGSCCEQNSARSYAENDKASLTQTMEQLNVRSKILLAAIERFVVFASVINQQKKTVPPAILPLFNAVIKSPAEYSKDSLLKIGNKLNDEFNGCRDFLQFLRGSSICNLCSGRSQVSFVGKKALLKDEVCQATVARCRHILTLPLQLTKKLAPFFEAVLKFRTSLPANPNSQQRHAMDKFQGLQKAVICKERSRVIDLANRLSSDNNKAKVEFCERLLRIYRDIYFVQVNKELQLAIDSVEFLNEDMDLIKSNNPQQTWSLALKKTLRRRLQSSNSFESMFAGDVIVVPPVTANVDSSYTSYYGAVGTTSSIGTNEHIPLNLTAQFR